MRPLPLVPYHMDPLKSKEDARHASSHEATSLESALALQEDVPSPFFE